MRLSQLEYYVAAVEYGTFAAASKKLYVTPQAISKAVADLEHELGVKLLCKTGSDSRVTPIGKGVYELSLKTLEDAERIVDLAAAATTPESHGETVGLAIPVSPNRGVWIESTILERVRRQCREVDLSYYYDSSGACLVAVESGLVDAAVVLGRINRPGVRYRKLFTRPLSIALSQGHPLASGGPLRLSEISNCEIVVPSDITYCFPMIKDRFCDCGLRPRFTYVKPGLEDVHLREKNGVMFVSARWSEENLPSGCAIVPLNEQNAIEVPVYFVEKETETRPIIRQIAALLSISKRESAGLDI